MFENFVPRSDLRAIFVRGSKLEHSLLVVANYVLLATWLVDMDFYILARCYNVFVDTRLTRDQAAESGAVLLYVCVYGRRL